MTPAEAGDAAREGGSRRLVLTHLPVDGDGSWARTTASEAFEGEVEVAEPSATYEI